MDKYAIILTYSKNVFILLYLYTIFLFDIWIKDIINKYCKSFLIGIF